MKGLKKLNWLYKVETLNHIIICNRVFSSVRNYYIAAPIVFAALAAW
jgi:hypothetical protein